MPRCIYEIAISVGCMNNLGINIRLRLKPKEIRMVSANLRRAFYRVKSPLSVRARAIIEALQTLNLPIQLTRHTRSRDIMLFTCSSIKRNLRVLGRIFALPYYVLLQRIYQRIRCTLIMHTLHTHSHAPAHSLKLFGTYTITIDIIAFITSWNLYCFPWRFFFVSLLMARNTARIAVNSWPKTVTVNIH